MDIDRRILFIVGKGNRSVLGDGHIAVCGFRFRDKFLPDNDVLCHRCGILGIFLPDLERLRLRCINFFFVDFRGSDTIQLNITGKLIAVDGRSHIMQITGRKFKGRITGNDIAITLCLTG